METSEVMWNVLVPVQWNEHNHVLLCDFTCLDLHFVYLGYCVYFVLYCSLYAQPFLVSASVRSTGTGWTPNCSKIIIVIIIVILTTICHAAYMWISYGLTTERNLQRRKYLRERNWFLLKSPVWSARICRNEPSKCVYWLNVLPNLLLSILPGRWSQLFVLRW
jgi:hypothetical protein